MFKVKQLLDSVEEATVILGKVSNYLLTNAAGRPRRFE
jgi:hypothetical protein